MLSNFLAYKNRMSLLWSIGRLCTLEILLGSRAALARALLTLASPNAQPAQALITLAHALRRANLSYPRKQSKHALSKPEHALRDCSHWLKSRS